MAEKDILEKILMSCEDVFADCINVLMYGGRNRLKPEEMYSAPTESFYQGRERMHNQFCDVSYYLMEGGEIRAQYMIGNEMRLKKRQVLRKASYEGGVYRTQLESGKPVYPVISMVLDWKRKSTRIPRSIHRLLRESGALPEDLQLVDDIRLTVHHMKKLPKEVRSRFTSDIGFVADYLNDGGFEGRRGQKIVHIKALCEMMEALTGDVRFTDQLEAFIQRQKEGREVVMCEYIDFLEARGEERGRREGEIEGERKGKIEGEKKGKIEGENRLASLLARLYSQGRDEEAKLAVQDENARKLLYDEFCIAY